jgi:branched-chain amino acid aminotransferase
MFSVGTAAILAPVGRVGIKENQKEEIRDLILPSYEDGIGPVSRAMLQMILAIQEGRENFEGWNVRCE